jgi:hypothetical protein
VTPLTRRAAGAPDDGEATEDGHRRERAARLSTCRAGGAIAAADQAGVPLIPVAGDRTGPDPDDLDRAFRETGARVFYAQPTYANPTGAQWPRALGEQVLDVVRGEGDDRRGTAS